MLCRAMGSLQRRLKPRKRGPRQPTLLARGSAPDPRLHQHSIDPNARFIGEHMRDGGPGL